MNPDNKNLPEAEENSLSEDKNGILEQKNAPYAKEADGGEPAKLNIPLPKWAIITILAVAGAAIIGGAAIAVISGNKPDSPAPHTHSFGQWEVAKEATCTEDGTSVRHCQCGESETQNLAAKGHSEVTIPATEPTCTGGGLTEGKSCANCDAIILEQTEIPKTDHTYDGEDDPDCNACDFVRPIDCKHANTKTIAAVKPTCTRSGLTEGRICADCDEILTEQKVVSAKGHIEVGDPAVAASCTETGLTAGKHCSACGKVTVAQTVTNKKDHNYVDGVCTACNAEDPDAIKYSEGFTFVSNNDGTCYINNLGNCRDTDIIIPPTSPTGDKVTRIGANAFANKTNLKSVVIPDSVTDIDYKAFYNCTGLTAVSLGNGLNTIGDFSFSRCYELTAIEIPESVTSIGIDSFSLCSKLTSIKIPDSVITIKDNAFYYCSSLTDVVIGDRVTSVGNYAFYNCQKLSSVIIGNSVTAIGNYAFHNCSVVSLVIPDSVTTIGDFSFDACSSIVSVTLGNKLSTIGNSSFSGCRNLTSIVIPDTVTVIGASAFSSCSGLSSIEMGIGVTTIGDGAFYGCGFTSVEIGSAVTTIGDRAFQYCRSLKTVLIPNSVTSIGTEAFGYTDLTSGTIPSSVTYIGNAPFCGCDKLQNIIVDSDNGYYKAIDGNLYTKDGKTLIQYAIDKDDTMFVVPDHVDTIGPFAFNNSFEMITIVIPKNVTVIGERAFDNCRNLQEIRVDANNQQYKSVDGVLYTKDGKTLLQYAVGKENSEFSIPEGVTNIGYFAFHKSYNLISIVIPESVVNIEDYAFYECTKLAQMNYNGSVDEWSSISLGYSWKTGARFTFIQCSDGQVQL